LDLQQQAPVKAKIANKAPITVKAIFAKLGFHQAKTMTKIAKISLQKQSFIFTSV
jgi:hypothetical protein